MGNGPKGANSENPNGPEGINFGPPPGAAPEEETSVAGGFSPGYKPPTKVGEGLQTSILRFAPDQIPEGAVGTRVRMRTTLFGTTPYDGQYVRDDAWTLPLQDPEDIPNLQRQLVLAGLLDPKKIREGLWDEASASAYGNVLGFANAYGLNANDALSVLINNPDLASTLADPKPIVERANPADINATYRQASQSLTGQEQDPTQFAQEYRGLEDAAYARRLSVDAAGGQYVGAPDIGAAAEQSLLANRRDDIQSYGAASRMLDFFDMVRGSA